MILETVHLRMCPGQKKKKYVQSHAALTDLYNLVIPRSFYFSSQWITRSIAIFEQDLFKHRPHPRVRTRSLTDTRTVETLEGKPKTFIFFPLKNADHAK